MPKVADVFNLMDCWRHLPDYQLERRADIFFAIYMKEIIEAATDALIDPVIVPEFPLRRGLIRPAEPAPNMSVKVDYALFAADRSRVFFVELKTAQRSRCAEQDRNLNRARELGFRKLVQGIVEIAQNSDRYGSYHHLLHMLEGLGFLSLPAGIESLVYGQSRRGLAARLQDVQVAAGDPPIDVFYVQPRSEGDERCIGFDAVARIVEQHDDELSRTFAACLRRWDKDAAISPPVEQTYSVATVE